MTHFFTIALFILFPVCSLAQKQSYNLFNTVEKEATLTLMPLTNFQDIDEMVRTFNTRDDIALGELSVELTGGYIGETQKVRSIFSWIALNIKYDSAALQTGIVPDQSAELVYMRGSAVCEGFANLFVSMCKAAGFESRLIKGYVRNGDRVSDYPNHAWNSVLIDGTWRLLDVTWAGLSYQQALFYKDANAFNRFNPYFLSKPKHMALTHLPEDPYWQLQPNEVSIELFRSGEGAVNESVNRESTSLINFELLIAEYDQLDSIDSEIALLERMVKPRSDGSHEYALGIAYFYKAQSLLQQPDGCDKKVIAEAKRMAKVFYQKSINQLGLLDTDDFGYDFSRELAENVSLRMDILQ